MLSIIKHSFIIGFILISLVAGCKKKTPVIPIDADLVKYFSYNLGTWWVYRDSVTGERDSFVIIQKIFGTESGNDEDLNEEIEDYYVYNNGYLDPNRSYGILNLQKNYISYIFIDSGSGALYMNYSMLFEYPFKSVGYTSSLDSYNEQYSVINFLPTYNLGGNTYDSVFVINQTDQSNSYNDIFYISKNAGIIKIRYNHSNLIVLELQSYHIVH